MMSAKGKRMKIVGLAIAISSVIGLSTQAFATLTCGTACPPPTAQITIGTTVIPVPVTTTPGGLFSVTEFTATVPGVGTARIDTLLMNPDPFIVFGVGATNLLPTPLVFAFAFTTPISIPGNLIDAAASIGYSLSDGAGDGVTLTAFDVPSGRVLIANDFFPPTNKGVNVGPTATGGVGPECGPLVLGTSVCGPFGATNVFAQPAVPFVIMGATVSFVLSGLDGAGLSGRVEQVAMPEPATLLLLGSGLAGLGAWRRYRGSR